MWIWAALESGCKQAERPFTVNSQKTRLQNQNHAAIKNSYSERTVYSSTQKTTSKTFLQYICDHNPHSCSFSIYIYIYILLWLTSDNCFTLISSLAISKLSLEERPVHSLIYIIENFLSATTQTLCASTSNSAPSPPQKSALLFGATRCSQTFILVRK